MYHHSYFLNGIKKIEFLKIYYLTFNNKYSKIQNLNKYIKYTIYTIHIIYYWKLKWSHDVTCTLLGKLLSCRYRRIKDL